MEKVFNVVNEFFGKMSTLFMTLLSFGIVAEILFGKAVLGMSVIDNVTELIAAFGNNGVVGLIALVILYNLLDKK
jgi:ABC-type antimicrobial peptide transport system permease subunit